MTYQQKQCPKCKHNLNGICTFITAPAVIKDSCWDYEDIEDNNPQADIQIRN